MKNIYRLTITIVISLLVSGTVNSQITYWLDQSALDSPHRDKIIQAMDSCISAYNTYSNYDEHVRVIYDETISTANAGYKGRIAFGGSIGEKTALHEMSHVLGVGTYREWDNNRDADNKKWLGEKAIAQLKEFDGEDAVLNADHWHFWPYGLNKNWADVEHHVYMVGALREDMGLSNTSGEGGVGYCNPAMLEGFSEINNGGEMDFGFAFAKEGDDVRLKASTLSDDEGSWSWSGPGDFSGNSESILINDVQKNQSGTYIAEFTKNCDGVTTREFSVFVHQHTAYYAIEITTGFLLRPENDLEGSEMKCADVTATDHWVQWEKIETDNGYFYLKNRKTGMYFRPKGNSDGDRMEQIKVEDGDERAQWKIKDTGEGNAFIMNRSTGLKFRITSGQVNDAYIEQTHDGNTAGWTRWDFNMLDDAETASTNVSEVNGLSKDDLLNCSPNPFSDVLEINFFVPETGKVWLEIFDFSGKRMVALVDGEKYHAGDHSLVWNGNGESEMLLQSGSTFLVRYRTGQEQASAKVMLKK